ncbi:MAG: cyclic nucleotide-binding domain-containing protein [Chloroflexi bacterium]|nr:cyclic nucleotide-binding domain-containing protein [Chloroflexota bacterium]
METLMRLRSVSLFASLTPDNLARVAEITSRRLYRQGELLCRAEDESSQTLYVIDSGAAILRQTDLQGEQRYVGHLREGAIIGDDALLFGDAYGFCAQATSTLEALCIRKEDFDRLLEERPEIRQQMALRPLVQERFRARRFSWQERDEPSLLLRRRHWFFLVRQLALPVVTLVLLALVVWLLSLIQINMSLLATVVFVGVAPLLMALWLFADWQNDFYLVTAKRVIHREKVILLYETLDEAPLEKIQNTNVIYGFLGKLLGFGTLKIETASMRGTMVLTYVPDPVSMREIISRRAQFLGSRIRHIEREAIRQELLRQTGRAGPEQELLLPDTPSVQEPAKPSGHLLRRLLPSRPIFALRYVQGNQIIWRKHWVFLIKHIYLALPAFFAITLFLAILLYVWPTAQVWPLLLVALVLWTAAFFWLWWEVEDWRNDIYILTDRVVLDIVKKPLFFSEDRKQASLAMVQNVSLRIPNPLAALLNYGDVVIQTAGPSGALNFFGVSRPADVQREVFRRIEAFNETRRRREMEQRKAELSTWFGVYYEEVLQKPGPSDPPPGRPERGHPSSSGQEGGDQ